MPTDPATVPPLADEALGELFDAAREKQDRVAMFSYRAWGDLPPQAKANVRIFAESIAALAAARVDTAEVERRAAREALTVYRDWLRISGPHIVEAERVTLYRDREYPAPAPRECVLSDKSVVTFASDRMWRRVGGKPITYGLVHRGWRDVLRDTDTGADFDALKRFAAEVGQ